MEMYDSSCRPDKVFIHLDDTTPFAERNAFSAAFIHVAINHMNNYGGNPDTIALTCRAFTRAYMDTTEENEKIVFDALMKKLYEGENIQVPENGIFYERQTRAMEKLIRERGLQKIYEIRRYELCQSLLYPDEGYSGYTDARDVVEAVKKYAERR